MLPDNDLSQIEFEHLYNELLNGDIDRIRETIIILKSEEKYLTGHKIYLFALLAWAEILYENTDEWLLAHPK